MRENSKIHIGLEKAELRDFLSLSVVKNYQAEFNNKKQEIPYHTDTILWALQDAQSQLDFWNKKVEILKERQALRQMCTIAGWQDFDVSEQTKRDLTSYTLCMNFVGTKEEYYDLLKKLKKENKQ